MVTFLFSLGAFRRIIGRCKDQVSIHTSGSIRKARACSSNTTGNRSIKGYEPTQKEATRFKVQNFNHATLDLYHAIEQGDYPEWELCVQVMDDGEHPELDFDPLDPTKLWPTGSDSFSTCRQNDAESQS